MSMRRIVALLAVSAVITLTIAGFQRAASTTQPSSPADVAALVESSLRCPTCQGMSIADSPAPVAAGMRKIVQEQAAAGRKPDEIRAQFVDRYGDWVLLTPPRRGIAWLLWLLPAVTLLMGIGLVAVVATKRREEIRTDSDAVLATALDVYASYRAGSFIPPATPAGERLEAALELLTSVDEEGSCGAGIVRRQALSQVAAALR
ncbi:MAG: hypothetical protein GEU97_14960 [Actinophytocola sp.]|nr:hypothetical protein [Actinophytocola sp.]